LAKIGVVILGIPVDGILGIVIVRTDKCFRRYAPNADEIAKYLSDQPEKNLFTVQVVLKRWGTVPITPEVTLREIIAATEILDQEITNKRVTSQEILALRLIKTN